MILREHPGPPLDLRLLGAVVAGGAVGASLRYLLGVAVPDGEGFPATTFTINVVGSALLALLPAVAWVRRSPARTAALGPGVLGGFTTLSAYAVQSRQLLADGDTGLAAAYVLGTVAACCLAIVAVRALVSPPGPEPEPS